MNKLSRDEQYKRAAQGRLHILTKLKNHSKGLSNADLWVICEADFTALGYTRMNFDNILHTMRGNTLVVAADKVNYHPDHVFVPAKAAPKAQPFATPNAVTAFNMITGHNLTTEDGALFAAILRRIGA